jgi:quercetin 2,3-dioxygenase
MNDDLVQPHRGFGTHPHSNMEIVTYVVDGELTHQDSMGTSETLGRGSIQFMTAGSGIRHSEFNHGDKPLRFIQTWIKPLRSGLKPNYGSYGGSKTTRTNQWQHLVSNANDPSKSTPVEVQQDVDVWATELDHGRALTYELTEGSQAYLLCIEGSLDVNGHVLDRYDACEITGPAGPLEVKATAVDGVSQVAHVLLVAMKAEPGSGRTDV